MAILERASSMNIKEYIESAEKENRLERYYCNGIDFYLITEKDGWVSILRRDGCNAIPLRQAKDRNYAIQFCECTEPVNFPIDKL